MEIHDLMIQSGLPGNPLEAKRGCLEIQPVEGDGKVYAWAETFSSVQLTGSLVIATKKFYWNGAGIEVMEYDGKSWIICHPLHGNIPVKVVFRRG